MLTIEISPNSSAAFRRSVPGRHDRQQERNRRPHRSERGGKDYLFQPRLRGPAPHLGTGRLPGQGHHRTATHAIAKIRIVRTFQGDNIFPDFSSWRMSSSPATFRPGQVLRDGLSHQSGQKKEQEIRERCGSILELVGLATRSPDPREKPRPRLQKNFRHRLCPCREADPPAARRAPWAG